MQKHQFLQSIPAVADICALSETVMAQTMGMTFQVIASQLKKISLFDALRIWGQRSCPVLTCTNDVIEDA